MVRGRGGATTVGAGALALLLLIAAYLLVPALQTVVYQAVGLGSAAVILVARRRSRAWGLVAGALLLFWLGDTIWDLYPGLTGEEVPFPSIADAAYLAAYPLLLLGTLALRGRRDGGATALLDTLILGIPLSAVIWVVAIEPTLAANEGSDTWAAAVSLSYPVADLFLLASLARLLMAPGRLSAAARLLAVALGVQLVGDLVYLDQSLGGTYVEGTWVDGLWLLSYGLMALAACHRSAEVATVPSDDHVPTKRRMVVLGVAVAAAPLALLLQDPHGHGLAGLAWPVVTALVMVRMYGLARSLSHLALHDALTGLPNRTSISALVTSTTEHGTGGTVLFCDLDGFKLVNDGLGHASGDRMLREVAQRLRRGLRSGDTVGRFGGDEFVVVCPDIHTETDAREIAARVEQILAEPFSLPDADDVAVGVSVGAVVLRPGTDMSADALLEEADAAMYRAKVTGRPEVAVAGGDRPAASRHRLQTISDLRGVAARGELRLLYQPELRISDGEVVGFEALVRWEHPKRGLLPPGAFIAEAERTGEIVRIGRWVVEEACRQVAAWSAATGEAPTVAVNVSARQLADPAFPGTILEAIVTSGIPPRSLVLEITETSAVADVELTRRVLGRLKAIGVGVAIDDFGTGQSSLSQLRSLPVDYLKIDRSFVMGLDSSGDDQAIVAAVVRMAGAMGLRTVAEGVERPAQLERLRELGCDYAQGFLFARPLPAEEALARPAGLLRP